MRLIVVFVACVLSFAAVAAAATEKIAARAENKDRPRVMKVAYLDLTRVLKGYQKWRDFDKELREFRSNLSKKKDERIARIMRYRREIEQLVAGSPERMQLEEKHQAAARALQEFELKARQSLNSRFVRGLGRVYAEIRQEATAIARERDLDMVIKTQCPEREARAANDLTLQIAFQTVLYAKAEHDLTAEVIKRLNEKHVATREKARKAPSASDKSPKAPSKKAPPAPAGKTGPK